MGSFGAAEACEVAPTLPAQRAGQGLYIVPDEVNVSGGRPLFAGQTVRIERAADGRPGLRRDAADQALVADIFEKNRRNFLGLDLSDDGSDVAGRGLVFG